MSPGTPQLLIDEWKPSSNGQLGELGGDGEVVSLTLADSAEPPNIQTSSGSHAPVSGRHVARRPSEMLRPGYRTSGIMTPTKLGDPETFRNVMLQRV